MSSFERRVLGCCTAALLAGCGQSQLPLNSQPPAQLQKAAQPMRIGRESFHIVHPFGRSPKDGKNPAADLIDVKGTLYGTTFSGGSHGGGTVFSITTSGEETVLHSFGGTNDGYGPVAALLNVKGALYGTTSEGGTDNGGTVFKITPSGTETVLHSFSYYGEGNPRAALINVGGTLYGTTAGLEGYFCGEVFSITTSGKFEIMHTFGKGSDGCSPLAPMLNVNGTLYGTTAFGGEFTDGTVFSITTTGNYSTGYSFGGSQSDGQRPMSALINVQGVLYGTTGSGGSADRGAVFSFTTSGSENTIYSFAPSGSRDGSQPLAALKNVKGVFYGTTSLGGLNNVGTVYKLTKSGAETVLHSFGDGKGVNPVAGVIPVSGTLYGSTFGKAADKGARRSFGNIFSLKI